MKVANLLKLLSSTLEQTSNCAMSLRLGAPVGFTPPHLINLTLLQALEHSLAELRYIEELLCERGVISEDRIQEIFVTLYSETEVDKMP